MIQYQAMTEIYIIAHNIRSTHNIGSIFRTCEGFGVKKIILSGYSPYPKLTDDTRLPHISDKLTQQIHKTALGAETMVPFEYQEVPDIDNLRNKGFTIVGLEQNSKSIPISKYKLPEKVALFIGEEVNGINKELLIQCDDIIEIPMVGKKESFNVSVATGIALYALTI
ncbi:MAG: TrmH family RNA methyltransferase [Candidatus Saccharibacteria bacterium]